MSTRMMQDPVTNLILPSEFVEERASLKKSINKIVDDVVSSHGHIKGTYFLTLHAKFDSNDQTVFRVDEPKLTKQLPSFRSNTLVYFVSNSRGIKELLWMVAPKMKGEKLKIEFNKKGVAYLQAKGAMPS